MVFAPSPLLTVTIERRGDAPTSISTPVARASGWRGWWAPWASPSLSAGGSASRSPATSSCGGWTAGRPRRRRPRPTGCRRAHDRHALRALIANGDGISSEGIRVLVVAGLEVVVAAPAEEASGSSAALTAVQASGHIVVEERPSNLPTVVLG
jgi:Survival protein SurE